LEAGWCQARTTPISVDISQEGTHGMRSKFFKDFGIPDVECDIEPRLDDHRVPRLFFRSTGNPLVGLDLTGASQLRQLLAHAGQTAQAAEINAHIETARRLG
jgi:hypothetical protein